MHKLLGFGAGLLLFVAATPSSSNYQLKSYDVGGSGGSSSSTNYRLNSQSGNQSGAVQGSSTYGVESGSSNTADSNVPPAPTVLPGNYYDKLTVVVNPGSNPSDTKYLIAVSTDNFATTKYVQTDNTLGSSQALNNYQSYAAWGGSSGFLILGLVPSTTYQVKVKALQGSGSGSAFSPTGSGGTVATSLTMSLATTATSTPPYPINFSGLTAGTVGTGSADAVVGVTSNANNGGAVYVRSLNAGLVSTLGGTSIPSATTDLTSATSGYGGRITAVSQAGGGPLTSQSPFNGTGNNVGALSTTLQPIVSTTGPVTTGSATLRLFAKASAITPSAGDYSDTLTFVIAMNY